MNKVELSGNLTRDIELKKLPNDTSTCSFTIACRRNFRNKDGEYDADFINCVAFGPQADFIAKYFTKGQGIIVCGEIRTRTWDDTQGTRHWVTEIKVDEVEFNGSKKEASAPVQQAAPTTNVSQAQNLNAPSGVGIDEDLPF